MEGHQEAGSFEAKYPRISKWVKTQGWIGVGQTDSFPNFMLALDEGGMVREGKGSYKSMDEAFEALEEGLSNV
ncbi:MAG TPA: hypothetical protein VF747_16155 [Blastocatellia bacterium]|jgi:hypothetical protein